jgi:hypothetical protein
VTRPVLATSPDFRYVACLFDFKRKNGIDGITDLYFMISYTHGKLHANNL